jgi:LPPG:FO 2-phospho-L-lactate transferase
MAKATYIAISGGVGGAKLALGLTRVLAPDEISFIVNTGDDFEHLGVHISPDIDTLVYTLAGESNTELGWGRRGETWRFMTAWADSAARRGSGSAISILATMSSGPNDFEQARD